MNTNPEDLLRESDPTIEPCQQDIGSALDLLTRATRGCVIRFRNIY